LPQLQPVTKNINSALVIGLGAGELPMLLTQSGLSVDVVEIDPVVKEMAEKYFAFELPKDQVYITDGRYFLSQTENNYDFIMLDAFNSDQVAWHLLSIEALQTAKGCLSEYGLLAINFTSVLGSEDVASLQATLKKVFPYVRLFNQDDKSGLTSLVFTASGHPIQLSADSTQLANQQLSDEQRVVIDAFIAGELGDLGGTAILSDDYNPISYQRRQVQMQWRREMRDYLGDDQATLLFN
jgi:spermidine synthase